MTEAASAPVLLVAILALAAVQIGVHLRCFLILDGSVEVWWNLIALILALIIALVMAAGSLWVVYKLDSHITPSTAVGG